MGTIVEIDEIDKKILSILIRDARARLKDIAKECRISSVSVLNRIRHLKDRGVITGSTLFPNLGELELSIVATIGIEADSREEEIIEFIQKNTDLIELSRGIGIYDLTAFVYSQNITDLDRVVFEVRKRFGVRKVTVNLWSGQPYSVFGNIDLQPARGDRNGST